MTDKLKEETTPDQLMKHFQGSSLKTIIIFTLIVHFVILAGSSFPFLYKTIFGDNTSKMSEKDKMELAVKEAMTAVKDIADKYELKPQDLSSRLAGGAPKAPKTTKKDATPKPPQGDPAADPDETKSPYEKELKKKATGPSLPKPEDDEDDLFK